MATDISKIKVDNIVHSIKDTSGRITSGSYNTSTKKITLKSGAGDVEIDLSALVNTIPTTYTITTSGKGLNFTSTGSMLQSGQGVVILEAKTGYTLPTSTSGYITATNGSIQYYIVFEE